MSDFDYPTFLEGTLKPRTLAWLRAALIGRTENRPPGLGLYASISTEDVELVHVFARSEADGIVACGVARLQVRCRYLGPDDGYAVKNAVLQEFEVKFFYGPRQPELTLLAGQVVD
jgi:hypothetical protein